MEVEAEKTTKVDPRRELVLNSTSASWQDYVTLVLAESGHVTHAAIHSLSSGNLWAATPGFRLSADEVAIISHSFLNDERVRVEGLTLHGRHFTVCRMAEQQRIVVGRDAKTGHGCVVYKCQRCLVAVIYEDANLPGACYNTVLQVGDFLVDNGL